MDKKEAETLLKEMQRVRKEHVAEKKGGGCFSLLLPFIGLIYYLTTL